MIIDNINNIQDSIFDGRINMNNQFDFNKNLNNNYTTLASSQIDWNKNFIENKNGLVFENEANLRIVSISIDSKNSKDTSNIRFYPQFSSVISLPLIKTTNKINQTLTPKIMPILAPYNNYTETQAI